MADMGAPLDRYREVETGEPFTPQNPRLLKIELSETSVMARNGSMVAYQGDVRFEHKGGGLGRLLKKAATGEQLRLMQATGSGELFLAHQAMRGSDRARLGGALRQPRGLVDELARLRDESRPSARAAELRVEPHPTA
jgi:hypothetical protein